MNLTKILLAGVLSATASFAQFTGGDFSMLKTTINNSGGASIGGGVSLAGTMGQPEAGLHTMKTGDVSLSGGFWANATIIDLIFTDGFESEQEKFRKHDLSSLPITTADFTEE